MYDVHCTLIKCKGEIMEDRTLRVLEFNKIKEILKEYIITESGKRLVEELRPYDTAYEVRRRLKEVVKLRIFLITKGKPSF